MTPDLGASVRQRLLNQAQAQERPFQELLQYYAMERFLYRLSKSRQAETFILKGALLLTVVREGLAFDSSRVSFPAVLAGVCSNPPCVPD